MAISTLMDDDGPPGLACVAIQAIRGHFDLDG
jgi:hypothetical protein